MIKYVKRTSKKLRQELLNKALKEELDILRKKCFPRKRIPFIFDDIEIKERNFTVEKGMEDTLGLYKYDEKQCKHIIYVSKSYIYCCQKFKQSWHRNFYYRRVKQIILHECIHALLKEKFEYKCKRFITEKNSDASPLFLSILYWCGGYTSHNCLKGFKQTELYNKLFDFKTYRELEEYLLGMLWEYTEAINQIQKFDNQNDFLKGTNDNYHSIVNNFEFAPRINGLEKFSEMTMEDVYKKDKTIKKYTVTNRTWHIGCNITPHMLIDIYNKKQDCTAKYFDKRKQLILLPNTTEINPSNMKVITVKKIKNFNN